MFQKRDPKKKGCYRGCEEELPPSLLKKIGGGGNKFSKVRQKYCKTKVNI